MGTRKGDKSYIPPETPAHYQDPRAQTHIEGDGQREEVGGKVAEDALEVVQVAPLIVAVGIHPDKVAAVRNIQATDGTALQRGKTKDMDDTAPRGEARLDLSRQLTMISPQPVPNPQRYPSAGCLCSKK